MEFDKKAVKVQMIKLGLTTKKQRRAFWDYVLRGNLGSGYLTAQDLQKLGFRVLKPLAYYEDQPN